MPFALHNRHTVQLQMLPPLADQATMLLVEHQCHHHSRFPVMIPRPVTRMQFPHPRHHSVHLLLYLLRHLPQNGSTQHLMRALQPLSEPAVRAHIANDNAILPPTVQQHFMVSVMPSVTFMGQCVMVPWCSLVVTGEVPQNAELKRLLFCKTRRR